MSHQLMSVLAFALFKKKNKKNSLTINGWLLLKDGMEKQI